MIKRVRFKWDYNVTDIVYWARMQFVTRIDGEWAIFSPGNVLGHDKSNAELDNLLVTSNRTWSSSNNLSMPFRWYTNYVSIAANNISNGGYVDIIFKEGLQVLQGFYYYFTKNHPNILEIYDENDVLIYNNDELELEYPDYNPTNAGIIKSTNYFYATPELELMKTYPINTLGTLETNDISRISNAYSVDQILPKYTEPDGTKIRFALSFDGRNTYKVCKHGTWTEIDKDKIIEDGMTGTELGGLISSNYVLALTESKTVDILVGMITENPNNTPNITKITTDYLEIV